MRGSLEVIVGSMYSGKSETLLSRILLSEIAHQPAVLLKHAIDDRYGTVEVVSHGGHRRDAHPVTTADEADDLVGQFEVVGVDEIQFFDLAFGIYLNSLADRGLRVIAAGLDTDFLGQPFPTTQYVTAMADWVDKEHAVCDSCKRHLATRSQLMRDGVEVTKATSTVLVGGKESYEARCRACFVTA